MKTVLLFAGGGESDTTGAAEAGQGADTTSGSLQDIVNNSISPFYIKKEIIEREEEDGMDEEDTETPEMIGVVLPAFEQSDPGTQSEDEGTRGLAGLFEERAGEKRAFPTAPPEPVPVPRIDHWYHVVRGLRAKDRKGIDLNKNGVVPVSGSDGFGVKGDDRFAFNSNSFKVEKGRNVSRSFDTSNMMCVTCPAGGQEVKQGKDGLPVVFALSDQQFSPCLPTTDRKDCIRVLRVEDGYLRERRVCQYHRKEGTDARECRLAWVLDPPGEGRDCQVRRRVETLQKLDPGGPRRCDGAPPDPDADGGHNRQGYCPQSFGVFVLVRGLAGDGGQTAVGDEEELCGEVSCQNWQWARLV